MAPAVLALLALSLPAPPQAVGREPTPAWVVELECPEPAGGPAAGGVEYLLQDEQDDLRGAQPVRYRRLVTRVAGAAGVDSESRLEVEFDPSGEELVLHRVAVHRDGAVSERLDALELRVLQREKGLEERLYDGRVTALAFLEDVRIGDRIEVAYSRRGRKAVLGERWFDSFATAWGVGVRRLHRRVLLPAGRELAVRLHAGAPEPQRRSRAEDSELVWDLRDVPAVKLEENAPSWHDPLPWAELSEYPDWPSVARWGAELFTAAAGPGDGVRALAAEIAGASDDPLERTRLALRRVQGDVRYLGLLFGEGSHRPSGPDEVLARRYGDCKDKALLLVALLGELGLEARPALVSTVELSSVREQLPSPGAFDHAIVRARVAGEELWLDPTQSSERGPLDELTLPDYGVALLLDGQAGDLVEVVRDRGTPPLTRVDKRYGLRLRGASSLEIVTSYTGARANAVREGLESLAPGALEDMCLQYLAEQHPRAEPVAAPTVEDDPEANRLTVRERYRIPDVFGRERLAVVGCVELAGEFTWPVALQRVHPFALPPPGRFEQHLEAELEGLGLGPSLPQTTRVSDGAFRFESRCGVSRGRLTIDASFETLRDHVPARDVARYADALERANAALHREVYPPGSPVVAGVAAGAGSTPGDEETARAIGGLTVALLVVGLALVQRRRDRRRSAVSPSREPAPGSAWVDGRTLVVARGQPLPSGCIRCNAPADKRRLVHVQWHSPWLYLLAPTVLFYFLAAAALAERESLRVGLCARHHRARLWTQAGNLGLLLVGTAVMLYGAGSLPVLSLVGSIAIVAGIVRFAITAPLLRAAFMDEHTLRLRGFGRDYLDSIGASTSVGNVPEERSAPSTAARSAA
jgi:hypothetical protein